MMRATSSVCFGTRGARVARSLVGVACLAVACGGSSTNATHPGSGGCPDVSKADEIAAFDFAKEYGVSAVAADKLKAALLTAGELAVLSDKIDADLGIACAGIAHDLGSSGDWRSAKDTCAAAIAAVQSARAKLGPGARTQLVVREPACSADPSLMTKCASLCDSTASAAKVRADCVDKNGRCEGACAGSCALSSPGKCDGACSGTCDGPFKGECTGRCVGTCDGKRVSGGCSGVCAGSCERGTARGDCKGACAGSCKAVKPGTCAGLCSGTCSVDFIDAKCAGEFNAPDVSEECRARCDLSVMNHRACGVPSTGILVTGAKVREADDAMKLAVERSVPALLKLVYEIGGHGLDRIQSAQKVVENARRTLGAPRSTGGARLAACFDAPLTRAADTAVAVRTGIGQALTLQDELSK